MNSAPQALAVDDSQDLRVSSSSAKPIISPERMRRAVPLGDTGRETVRRNRSAIEAILSGRDQERLLVVCGPCSIDDVNAALVYGERLRALADALSDRLVVVMRTYFEKPRSVVGWKGLMYDSLSGQERAPTDGITVARRLAVRLNEDGMACATEFLNPMLALYLEDCMAYGSIGSRTVESQIHRELASRLDLPMGMKNAMDGSVESALNGVRSAQSEHAFFGQDMRGVPSLVETGGNAAAHVILRGGNVGPNFDEATVSRVVEEGRGLGLQRSVVIDCSHGNSGKNHQRQAVAFEESLRQWKKGQSGIAGLMLESHLVEGRQDADIALPRRFGQSITDACIGWNETESLLRKLADSM